VIRRQGNRLLIDNAQARYWMRVDHWQEWCEKSGAESPSQGRIHGSEALADRRSSSAAQFLA
jgi:hypothetical protein